jgi:formylmethanofuran dehydrogenase subunit A
MKCVEDLSRDNKPIMHLTHCQFSAFKGSDWLTLSSGADKIAKYVNQHDHVTLDTGQVVFTDTTTMTADGPWQFTLYELSGNKWINHDVETETGGGIVPFRYKRKSYVHAMMWSIALELALLIDDPWKIFLTTDHPNGAPFTTYPLIISWLMSKSSREKMLKKINKRAKRRGLLSNIEREYSLYEIAIATRAGQAKALGLKHKGHLGIGADADIAIYNLNPEKIELSKKPRRVRKAFEKSAYTIKDGYIVSKNGVIVKSITGKTMWVNIKGSSSMEVKPEFKRKFKDYWTIEYDNYFIPDNFLTVSDPISVRAEV